MKYKIIYTQDGGNNQSTLMDLDNEFTDKNTRHSYLPLYQKILSPIKNTAKNVLEIGIHKGGSIKIWNEFFINAKIYGLDIHNNWNNIINDIKNNSKIILDISHDAYNESFFKDNFLNKNIKFDFILDDGPHTLESMKQCIILYSQIMTENGILIIEDVQSIDWIDKLKDVTPEHLKQYIHVYDLRNNKGRYDDIVFVINKNL